MSGTSDIQIPPTNQDFYLERSALVAMAEFVCSFNDIWLPVEVNLLKIPQLLTGQIALHHCLAPSLIDCLHTWLRMSKRAFNS